MQPRARSYASSLRLSSVERKVREGVEVELGLRPDQRSSVAWFIQHRWKPMREGIWRDSTRGTNEGLLKAIVARFGQTALEDMDTVEMQAWLNDLARRRSGSFVKHCRIFLRSIMAEAAEQDHLRKNPARLPRVPVLKPIAKGSLTPEEIVRLLKAAQFHARDRVLLLPSSSTRCLTCAPLRKPVGE